MNVYTCVAKLPAGKFQVAVLAENENDARSDIRLAIQNVMIVPYSMTYVKEVKKTTRRVISSMAPIKNCTSHVDGQWGWAKKIK